MIKLPTGKADAGVSTGKADFSVDGVVSKEAAKLVEVSGYGGYEWRGSPDGFDIPGGAFRWGTGLTFPVPQLPARRRRAERLRARPATSATDDHARSSASTAAARR